MASGKRDGSVRIWNLQTQTAQESAPITKAHAKAVTSLAFSPDGKVLATGGADWTAKLWTMDESRGLRSVPMKHEAGVTSIAFSPTGNYLATASWDKRVRLWNLSSGSPILEKTFEHKGPVMGVAFADDDLLASVSLDQTVLLWKPSQGDSPIQTQRFKAAHGFAQLYAVAFTSDGNNRYLAVVGEDKVPHVIAINDGFSWQEVGGFGRHKGLIRAVSFSPDSTHLVTAGFDKIAKVWNVSNGQEVMPLNGHSGIVMGAVFTDSRHVATASEDCSIKLWELARGVEAISRVSVAEPQSIAGVSFSADGKLVVTANKDKGVRIYDAESADPVPEFAPLRAQAPLTGVAVNADFVAAGGEDGSVYAWAVHGDHHRRSWTVASKAVTSVAISPTEPWVLAADEDKGLSLWDMSALTSKVKPNAKWSTTLSKVANEVSFSSDGRFLGTAQQDWSANIWAISSGEIDARKPLCKLAGHTDEVTSIAFSPTGNAVATGSKDGTAKIWSFDRDGGCAERFTITEHKAAINRVRFSSDGKLLATASADSTVKIWDVLKEYKTLDFAVVDCSVLPGQGCDVTDVAFSPDGKRIAASGKDAAWRIYWLDTANLIQIAKRRVRERTLQEDECARYMNQRECPPSPWVIGGNPGVVDKR